ncbi:unnamed protein product [Clavelina lepadiformis]|uniref:Uncharacterized protein n=1 Tax=Clavelina lepadiformis TaxID=159417 RepID=A0ABP0FQA6_CLALP
MKFALILVVLLMSCQGSHAWGFLKKVTSFVNKAVRYFGRVPCSDYDSFKEKMQREINSLKSIMTCERPELADVGTSTYKAVDDHAKRVRAVVEGQAKEISEFEKLHTQFNNEVKEENLQLDFVEEEAKKIPGIDPCAFKKDMFGHAMFNEIKKLLADQ